MAFNRYMDCSEEVNDALRDGRAVVALESTIIAHGMPYPVNLETAGKVEKIVRERDAVPATIAVVDGRIRVGLDEADLELLASSDGILKASMRDLPAVVAGRLSAATTVAGTVVCANLAGIEVFATGGIGGVHRNAGSTFDISADLQALSRVNVAVVSAGAKAVLDLALTLEYLETLGIPLVGYGTDEFPAFYARESGLPVPHRMDTPREIARMIRVKWDMGLEGGVIVANPVPESHAMDRSLMDAAIERALEEADRRRIRGKDVTPFLLSRIAALTGGRSLEANIALVCNNARLAAEIALELVTSRKP